MASKWYPFILGLLFAVAVVTTSPTSAGKSPKSEQKREIPDGTFTSDEKDKRSQEEIMFGNQQNKPAGMVDDILSFPERKDGAGKEVDIESSGKNSTDEASGENGNKYETSSEEVKQPNDTNQRHSEDKEEGLDYYDYLNDMDESRSFEAPPGNKNAQIPRNSPSPLFLYDINDEIGDYSNYDYNNGLYRRKRAALKRRALRMRKRSLHSNLDDLLRSRRLHRRALRLKRDTNVEDLLAWLSTLPREDINNDKYREGDGKLTISSRLPSPVMPLPGDVNDLDQEYPYGIPSEDNFYAPSTDLTMAEGDFVAPSDLGLYYGTSREEFPTSQREELPQWGWMPAPSKEINLIRRTTPFYPADYRFFSLPGQKKRSSSFRNREPAVEVGRWGKIVDRRMDPFTEGADDDMERLYALANLLAEADEPSYRYRKRRSA